MPHSQMNNPLTKIRIIIYVVFPWIPYQGVTHRKTVGRYPKFYRLSEPKIR